MLDTRKSKNIKIKKYSILKNHIIISLNMKNYILNI